MWFVPLGSHRSQRKHPFGKNGEKHQGVYFVETRCRKTGDLSKFNIADDLSHFSCYEQFRLSVYQIASDIQYI